MPLDRGDTDEWFAKFGETIDDLVIYDRALADELTPGAVKRQRGRIHQGDVLAHIFAALKSSVLRDD